MNTEALRHPLRALLISVVVAFSAGCSDPRLQLLVERAQEGDFMARGELMAMGDKATLTGTAAYFVGLMYDPILWPDGDAQRAGQLYNAARSIEPRAAHNLAVLVLTGRLADTAESLGGDTLEAVVVSAAERGVPEAMVLAGEFYTLGVRGFRANNVLAVWWFERAVAANGDPWARFRLGEVYGSGVVRPPSVRASYDLLASAAKAGVPEAARLLATRTTDRLARSRWIAVAARMGGVPPAIAIQRAADAAALDETERAMLGRDVAMWIGIHKVAWVAPQYPVIHPVTPQ